MNLPIAVKSAALFIAPSLFVLPLQGCAIAALLFGPSNSVKSVELAQVAPTEKSAIIVVAMRSDDPLAPVGGVILTRFNPETRRTNDCVQHDRAELSLPAGRVATIYRAFDVPPGTYVFPWHLRPETSKAGGFPAFVVRPGTVTFVGEFVRASQRDGTTPLPARHGFHLERDLARALRDLGPMVGHLELAETIAEPTYHPTLCTI